MLESIRVQEEWKARVRRLSVEQRRRLAALVREKGAPLTGSDGDQRLVAYVVCRPGAGAVDPGELKAHLRQFLPEFMVPAAFVRVAAVPRHPNGKVNRRELPDPSDVDEAGRDAPIGGGGLERVIVETWASVLGVPAVRPEDDFFELGGHSLLAIQAASQIRERTNVAVSLRTFFEAPVFSEFVARVKHAGQSIDNER